jgi:hypothetical protein
MLWLSCPSLTTEGQAMRVLIAGFMLIGVAWLFGVYALVPFVVIVCVASLRT